MNISLFTLPRHVFKTCGKRLNLDLEIYNIRVTEYVDSGMYMKSFAIHILVFMRNKA